MKPSSGLPCYSVTFNAGAYGTVTDYGIGNSTANTFTGLLASPIWANGGVLAAMFSADMGGNTVADGYSAEYVLREAGSHLYSGVARVASLPIVSATSISCF